LRKGTGYEPHFHKLTPETASSLIKKFNGLAVIAHPAPAITGSLKLNGLLPHGLDGIEVFHDKHNSATEKGVPLITEKYNSSGNRRLRLPREQTYQDSCRQITVLRLNILNNFKLKSEVLR